LSPPGEEGISLLQLATKGQDSRSYIDILIGILTDLLGQERQALLQLAGGISLLLLTRKAKLVATGCNLKLLCIISTHSLLLKERTLQPWSGMSPCIEDKQASAILLALSRTLSE